MSDNYNFGPHIQRLLETRSISIVELAELSGVGRKTIARAINNDPGVTMAVIHRIATALRVPVSELLEPPDDDKFQLHRMTGIRLVDQAIYRFLRMRSMPPGPERAAIEDEIHMPFEPRLNGWGRIANSGCCASPHYTRKTQQTWRKMGIECVQLRKETVDGYNLYGIGLQDELRLNDKALVARPMMTQLLYKALTAYAISPRRVVVIVEAMRSIDKITAEETTPSTGYEHATDKNGYDAGGDGGGDNETESDGVDRGRTVLTEYTIETLTFNTVFSEMRRDRPPKIGYKHWALMPELRPQSVKLVTAFSQLTKA